MSRVQFTDFGARVSLCLLVVLVFGVAYRDWLLLLVGVGGVVLLVQQYFGHHNSIQLLPEVVAITPGLIDESISAGSKFRVDVVIESDTDLVYNVSVPYGELDDPVFSRGKMETVYRYEPTLSTRYSFDMVEVSSLSRWGLFEGKTGVPFEVSINVFPRVFSAALSALEYLEGRGILGAGEQVSTVKGRGYEYADSREYVAGDSLKMVDWKATARLNRLIVKEYYQEGSGAVHIVYENRVSDPVSSDELSSCFLRTVQSFAEGSWVIGLTIIEDGEVMSHFPSLHPDRAVSEALRFVLENDVQVFRQLYEVLDPVYRPRLDLLVESESRGSMEELKDGVFRSRYAGVVYVTSLVDDPLNVFEVVQSARLSGTRMVVLEPCTPWVHVGLEEAYRIWMHYERVNRSLASAGVAVAVSLDEAVDRLAVGLEAQVY